VNIVLRGQRGGDRARGPVAARQAQNQAIFWGSPPAIVLRIILTLFAVALLALSWLKIVGSCCCCDRREAARPRG